MAFAIGDEMALVVVKYKYGSPHPNITSKATLSVQGTTESAVLAELERRYPRHENIIILDIEVTRP
ncbi:hypothetical protein D3C83_216710 [compost metagenome]